MNVTEQSQKSAWAQKGFALLLIVFCMELGVFLMFYPWTDQWTRNIFPARIVFLRPFWLNGYFRGALSGVGVLNLWISLVEVFRLRRFSPPKAEE